MAPTPMTAAEELAAAWAAAEAEAERELAEQDARDAEEAARRAANPAAYPVTPAAQPAARNRGRELRFVALAVVFACGGWGLAIGQLVLSKRPPAAPAEQHGDDHAKDKDAKGKDGPSLASVDAQVRTGKYADALRECRDGVAGKTLAKTPARAFREGLCLEALGRWTEAAEMYREAEADPTAALKTAALLGQTRCMIRDESYLVARAVVNRALLRSNSPDGRGTKARDEALFLRARLALLEAGMSGHDPLDAPKATWPFARATAAGYLDGLPKDGAPKDAAPARDALEVHRLFESPGALQVSARLADRPVLDVLRAVAATAGWKVDVSDALAARLSAKAGAIDADHVPLAEFLCALTEGAGVAWAVQGDTLILTPAAARAKR